MPLPDHITYQPFLGPWHFSYTPFVVPPPAPVAFFHPASLSLFLSPIRSAYPGHHRHPSPHHFTISNMWSCRYGNAVWCDKWRHWLNGAERQRGLHTSRTQLSGRHILALPSLFSSFHSFTFSLRHNPHGNLSLHVLAAVMLNIAEALPVRPLFLEIEGAPTCEIEAVPAFFYGTCDVKRLSEQDVCGWVLFHY